MLVLGKNPKSKVWFWEEFEARSSKYELHCLVMSIAGKEKRGDYQSIFYQRLEIEAAIFCGW